jgi:hypothetical protein
MTEMEIIHETDVSIWTEKIRPHLAGAVEHIVAAGREFMAAKDALPHGEFGALCESLGVTTRTAQRFMAIARHPVLSDPTRASHLPASWSTLAELARLEEVEATDAVDAGKITPKLDRSDARIIVAEYVTNRDQEEPRDNEGDENLPERVELGVRSKRRKQEFGVHLLTFSCLSIQSLDPDWVRTLTADERDEWVDYSRRSEAGIRRFRRQLEKLNVREELDRGGAE